MNAVTLAHLAGELHTHGDDTVALAIAIIVMAAVFCCLALKGN